MGMDELLKQTTGLRVTMARSCIKGAHTARASQQNGAKEVVVNRDQSLATSSRPMSCADDQRLYNAPSLRAHSQRQQSWQQNSCMSVLSGTHAKSRLGFVRRHRSILI